MLNPAYDVEFDPEAPNESRALALSLVGSNKRVIEFGCSTGRVTEAMVDRGCRVTGIELDPSAAERARKHAEEVLVLDLDYDDFEAKLAGQLWEVALLGDVIEHLRDPLRVLRLVRQLLERDGTLIISVPNIAHADMRLTLLDGRFPYGSFGLLDRTHLRFFTLGTITKLLEDAGFVPVETLRVVVPAFETELRPDPERFPRSVVDIALADPEAESYQYVIRSVLDSGDAVVRELAVERRRLEQELWSERVRHQIDLHQAEAVEAELHSVKSSRTMRYSAPLRAFYRRLRSYT